MSKVKQIVFSLLVNIYSLTCLGQADTINEIDATNGWKQGWWIIKNDVKKLPGYAPDAKVEEGKYLDSKKEGVWTTYYPNGKIKSLITFKQNKPRGPAKFYYENGCLKEEGNWKNNRWIGDYYSYREDSCNMLFYHMLFDSLGKRESPIEWGSGVEMKMKNDSGKKDIWPPERSFNGTGYAKLYNKNMQLSKEGTFKNYRLIDGKDYIYNKEGILDRVAFYKNGKYVGDAPIEE